MKELVKIHGYCAGHPEHPELLWVFEKVSEKKLVFREIEIDFPEIESSEETETNFSFFDADMSNFTGCPYCEAKLYFFCKKCHSLSCFSWDQLDENQRWTCWGCKRSYRMRIKTTPFQIALPTESKKRQETPSSRVVVKRATDMTAINSTIVWNNQKLKGG